MTYKEYIIEDTKATYNEEWTDEEKEAYTKFIETLINTPDTTPTETLNKLIDEYTGNTSAGEDLQDSYEAIQW